MVLRYYSTEEDILDKRIHVYTHTNKIVLYNLGHTLKRCKDCWYKDRSKYTHEILKLNSTKWGIEKIGFYVSVMKSFFFPRFQTQD